MRSRYRSRRLAFLHTRIGFIGPVLAAVWVVLAGRREDVVEVFGVENNAAGDAAEIA